MITVETNEKGAKKTGRSRYWSVMLVGEHGRVIPFRHFKALTVGVGIVLILSLCALILLGVLHTHQRGQIGALQENLEQMRAQSTKFRDEKDLYLTQLIALQKQIGALPQNQKPVDETQTMAESSPSPADVKDSPATEKATPEAEEVKKEVPVQEAESRVQWSADIRDFKVSYDNRQGVLNAQFRIYNTSRPKKRLSGRTVVAFKATGDPPSHWAVVPSVPLNNETPVGREGRSFKIRNYQTERFKTLRRKDSPKYDLAAVYIFTEQGELIANKEMPFNVDYHPPEPAKPVIEPPKPEPERSVGSPQVPQVQNAGPTQNTPGDSMAPDSEQTNGGPPSTIKSTDSTSGPPSPATPPGEVQPKSRLDSDGNGPPESEEFEAIPQTPAAEPKPAQEGDTQ
jgi:hypothetical protein